MAVVTYLGEQELLTVYKDYKSFNDIGRLVGEQELSGMSEIFTERLLCRVSVGWGMDHVSEMYTLIEDENGRYWC